MTLPADIAALKIRIARAESERDTWHAAGKRESYLEAYSMVEALELQLNALERTARLPAAPGATIIPIARAPAHSPGERERLMAELCISFNGRRYGYGGYRYDRLPDAVDYARLDRSRAFVDPVPDDDGPPEEVRTPSGAERELMRTLAITYADGLFHWREYRYERLADAVDYASLERSLPRNRSS